MRRHRPGPRRQSPVSYESVAEDARIVWFWCVREVGQSRAEVLDLPCLTDLAAGRVIGSRPDQLQPISAAGPSCPRVMILEPGLSTLRRRRGGPRSHDIDAGASVVRRYSAAQEYGSRDREWPGLYRVLPVQIILCSRRVRDAFFGFR